MSPEDNPIIYYDGECGLCSRTVQFVLKKDRSARIRFCALQSDVARERLRGLLPMDPMPDTVVLQTGEALYLRSAAALRIGILLGFPYSILGTVLLAVPPVIREGVYRLIARNRLKFFGKAAACMMLTPELKTRFLDLTSGSTLASDTTPHAG